MGYRKWFYESLPAKYRVDTEQGFQTRLCIRQRQIQGQSHDKNMKVVMMRYRAVMIGVGR